MENTKKLVAEFKGRINTEVRRWEKVDLAEEKDFRRGELPGKYIVKMLYKWDNGKFKNEYLRKLERNWQKWKGKKTWEDELTSFSRSRNFEERIMSNLQSLDPSFF